MVTNPRGAVYIKADQPVKRIPWDFSSGAPCKAEKEEYNVKYAWVLPGAFLYKMRQAAIGGAVFSGL